MCGNPSTYDFLNKRIHLFFSYLRPFPQKIYENMTHKNFIKITAFILFAFIAAPQAEAQLFKKKKEG